MGRSAAERKRDQRARWEQSANELPTDQWNEAICLYVLQAPHWRKGAMGEAAWRRLGELRGYRS